MARIPVVILLLLCAARPSAADEPIVVVARLGLHSAFWINLHHTLYGAAWARRPKTGARRLIVDLPAPLSAPLAPDEREAWESAVEYGDRNLADRDLLADLSMMRIKLALAGGPRRRRDRRGPARRHRACRGDLPAALLACPRSLQPRVDSGDRRSSTHDRDGDRGQPRAPVCAPLVCVAGPRRHRLGRPCVHVRSVPRTRRSLRRKAR